MVKVTGYQKRQSQTGGHYYALELQSDDLEFQVSKETGRTYAKAKKSWMTCTFDENVCQLMIGKEMPGSIIKEDCEPYTFTVEETGESITIAFRYVYQPEQDSPEEAVFSSPKKKELA
jgi:hypothetical protein